MMINVSTELASVEDHDNTIRKAIERRAYALYAGDDFRQGNALEHWLRAEREFMVEDIPLSIEGGAFKLRIPTDQISPSSLVISISPHSILIFGLAEDSANAPEGPGRDVWRFISLPAEVDPSLVRCTVEDSGVAVELSLLIPARALAQSQ